MVPVHSFEMICWFGESAASMEQKREEKKKMATDMTKGSIIPQITRFTIPLVLGNLFQLTYNAADSVIVGKFVGDDALAAVGTAGPIMNMVILFITGMCMGAGILMSTHYGAKDYGLLERQISTSMLGGLGFSAVISHPLLELLQVPENIIGDAKGYLRIIFLGLIFTFIYNFFSNTLRALGDSKVPLYFLMISALLNVIGDLFFVVVLGWGVLGSAAATVLSEMLCCLFCLIYIRKKVPLLCLGKKWKAFDGSILWKTFNYGITSALQQNRGAGNIRRMKQGFLSSVLIQLVYTSVVAVLVFFGARPIMQLFVGDGSEQVIQLGVSYLRLIALMYLMPAATNTIQGFFRGLGDLKVTLISTILNMSARFFSAWLMIHILHGGFDRLAWANFFGWVAMLALQIPLIIMRWRKEQQTS